MNLSRPLAVAVPLGLLALLALPAAAAGLPQPRFYFLVDGPQGHTGDGLLDPYNPAKPNIPNATVPQTRQVFPAASDVEPVQFRTAEPHPDRLKGPVYAALWLAPSAFRNANLTLTLYEVPAGGTLSGLPVPLPDPFLPAPAGPGAPKALASASVALDANASKLPDPTQLVPPAPGVPPPTDPNELQAYVLAIVGTETAKLYPALLQPPQLFYMGNLDVAVGAGSSLALGFTITKGSSPAPIPVGAFGQFEYDAALAPSYALLPWYNSTALPQPPAAAPSYAPASSPTESSPAAGGQGTQPDRASSSTGGGKSTPDAGLLALPALAALAAALRRRAA